VQGNRASASGAAEEAVQHYQRALASGGPSWSKRPRAIEALSMRLYELGRKQEIFDLAVRDAPSMPPSTALVNVLVNAIDAAADLKPEATAIGLPKLLQQGSALAEDRSAPVLLDDRSSLFLSLVEALKSPQPDESKRLARVWAERLEGEAARAPTPQARRVWDPHRVEAYLALDEPARALPMLQQSAGEVPDDYNPPARLARVYLALHDLPAARNAIDRALPLSDGPRKLRLYQLKADISIAANDRAAARSALQAALKFAQDSKLSPQYDKLRQSIERRLQES
jgi:tetratricopeptide (TPR) repeat protein